MKYTYAYKTSDGVRHEDSMNAASREEVFAELRKRGIKAIKVVAADMRSAAPRRTQSVRAHEPQRGEVAARSRDKALTTMPSRRTSDKSGHRRKAFLPSPLVKVVTSRRGVRRSRHLSAAHKVVLSRRGVRRSKTLGTTVFTVTADT